MSNELLPKSWARAKLKDVVEPRRDRVMPSTCPDLPFLGMDNVEAHTTRILGTIPASEVKSSAARFVSGDVLYGRLRPYLNKVARPDFDGIASGEFIVFPDQEHLHSSFLQSRLNARDFVNFASHINAGDRPRVDFDQIGEFEIEVPPAKEQRRIIEKTEELFSDLDAGVAALERARANLKRYRAAVLKAAVEGRLTEAWRKAHPAAEHASKLLARILAERRKKWEAAQLAKFAAQGKAPPKGWKDKYPEPTQPDTANLPELPEGWCWATVDQVSQLQRYGSSAKTSEEIEGVPVLRMGNIQDGNLDLEKLKYLPDDHHEFPDLLLEKGDLLFNRTNSAELVGKTAVYKGLPERCSFASYLIGVRLVEGCMPDYVSYFINSLHGRRWVGSVVSQQVGQANVNGTKLAALTFPLPPENEQRAIVLLVEEKLSIAEKTILELERNQERASRLRQSILKRAFEGKLVPQDPNDEPASALLARIRAARAKDAAKPRAAKRGRPAKART